MVSPNAGAELALGLIPCRVVSQVWREPMRGVPRCPRSIPCSPERARAIASALSSSVSFGEDRPPISSGVPVAGKRELDVGRLFQLDLTEGAVTGARFDRPNSIGFGVRLGGRFRRAT